MLRLNLLAIRVAGHGLDAYARRGHLYSPDVEGDGMQSERRDLLTTVAGYVVAILIGLALPTVAVAVYFGLALYLVWPFLGVQFPSLAFVALAGERSATWPSSTGSGGGSSGLVQAHHRHLAVGLRVDARGRTAPFERAHVLVQLPW